MLNGIAAILHSPWYWWALGKRAEGTEGQRWITSSYDLKVNAWGAKCRLVLVPLAKPN